MGLARRHAFAALEEPCYDFRDVPRCAKDDWLRDSRLFRVDDREEWIGCLGELVQLCNEASSRQQQIRSNAAGKPLSLEYIADRLDLDDPMHGYMVRSKEEGWLQGFATVTRFTTYQRWFRWDSLADEAGLLLFDEAGRGMDSMHEMGMHCFTATTTNQSPRATCVDKQWWESRLVDGRGELAAALNAEIRDGDPDDEGIIWPRVAELSLLGGLGCGSRLVDLIVEELERPESPYNFLVLQATENSVPFYESKGFIRVGAVARYLNRNLEGQEIKYNPPSKDRAAAHAVKLKPESMNGASSSHVWYRVNKEKSETMDEIANKHGVFVEDVIFMNRRKYGDGLRPSSKLMAGSMVRIPTVTQGDHGRRKKMKPMTAKMTRPFVACDGNPGEVSRSKLWYTARAHETPRGVAAKLGVMAKDMCRENISRYPQITSSSILQQGTRLRIPGRRPTIKGVSKDEMQRREESMLNWHWGSDEDDENEYSRVMCYRHWSFSDDPVALTCASYMMARPLRKADASRNANSSHRIEQLEDKPEIWSYEDEKDANSVAAEIDEYESATGSRFEPECTIDVNIYIKGQAASKSGIRMGPFGGDSNKKKVYLRNAPLVGPLRAKLELPLKRPRSQPPVPPLPPILCYCLAHRKSDEKMREALKRLKGSFRNGNKWSQFSSRDAQVRFPYEKKMYKEHMMMSNKSEKQRKLFNKVVHIIDPPYHWRRKAFFDRSKPPTTHIQVWNHYQQQSKQRRGRYEYYFTLMYIPDMQWLRVAPMHIDGVFPNGEPRYVLVPENSAQELDVSAKRCVEVDAKAMKRSRDADMEEWSIFDTVREHTYHI